MTDTAGLIGPKPASTPAYPTPWTRDGDALLDANKNPVADFHYREGWDGAIDLAELIKNLVNAEAAKGNIRGTVDPAQAERKLSHLVDCDGDKWFEVDDDRWVIASGRVHADTKAQIPGNGINRKRLEIFSPVTEVFES